MGTTPTFGFPYPDQTNSVDVADDIASLAQSIDLTLPLFAPLDSPTFVGVPKAPTASATTNDTQIATTEFVHSQGYITEAEADDRYADANGGTSQNPTLDGIISVPSLSDGVVLASSGELTSSSVLSMDLGGTGNATTTASGVVYVDETNSAFAYTSAGSPGQYLQSQGTGQQPIWSDVQSNFNGTITPTEAQQGALWVDTTNNVLKVYDETNGWQVVAGTPRVTKAANSELVLSDAGCLLEVSSASAAVINIPNSSVVDFPIGTTITIVQTGAGRISVNGTSGVTVVGTPTSTLRAQWSTATLYKRESNNWLVAGDLL